MKTNIRRYVTLILLTAALSPAAAQVDITADPQYDSISQMLDYAETLQRRPYREGAEGPFAFDCSGFTRFCYKTLGITLDRSSKQQSEQGKRIRWKKRIRPGDLVFYKGSTGDDVGHVGIVVAKGDDKKSFSFIHASSSVGITTSSSETDYFKNRYVKVMRITKDKEINKYLKKKKEEEKKEKKNQEKEQQNKTSDKNEKSIIPADNNNSNTNEGLKTLTGKTYVVKAGDTLYNIARRAACSVGDLQKWNNLKSNGLSVGQKLIIRGDE